MISIKCTKNIIDKVRESINKNKNIIESRITLIPDILGEEATVSEITVKDHIEQFKEYILKTLGICELLQDEINNL